MSSSSLVCELSGQPLSSIRSEDAVVVTPSGHICLKRLLLSKLADNGGVDPFLPTASVPLAEDQLVTLQRSAVLLPPRPHVTSFPNILSLLQTEYDTLVLELFDTRKLLESTRQELSQALYQSDAATRVIARLIAERDTARQQLSEWQASGGGVTTATTTQPPTDTAEPPTKRAKLATDPESSSTQSGGLTEEHLAILTKTWETLSQNRKQQKKVLAEHAVSIDTLKSDAYANESFHKAWHKARGKAGVLHMSVVEEGDRPLYVVTYGRDKQIVVYEVTSETVKHNMATNKDIKGGVSCLDANGSFVVAGDEKTPTLHVFSMETGDPVQSLELQGASGGVVQVDVHPSNQHVVACTQDGRILLCAVDSDSNELSVLTTLQAKDDTVYTCGSLHPDGLLYLACTSAGTIDVWDIKSQTLATTLSKPDAAKELVSVAFSCNGYHFAAASSDEVMVWDLRKQKLLTTLTSSVGSVSSVSFDATGKYVVQCGDGGVLATTVKEWDSTARIGGDEQPASELVWCLDNMIVACSDKERQVRFYGIKKDS